jgi:acyl-CoA thioesterase-1
MILGQSAATAACLAIDDRAAVQAVSYVKLRARLLADQQVLGLPGQRAAAAPSHPSFAAVRDVPGLPRVLLIGDSISMGYTLDVRAGLAGVANVHRPPANCNSSGYGLAQLSKWLGDGKWDVIHFNFGIHDAKLPPEGKLHSSLEVYEKNLREIVRRLRASGAKLVWATSTPIPMGGMLAPDRRFGDIAGYNERALMVMKENGVVINDLNATITPHIARVQIQRDVHFTPEGSGLLARQTAAVIKEQLRLGSRL